jgi:hypothetical protein
LTEKECTGDCVLVSGVCSDDCSELGSRSLCSQSHCTYLYSSISGDDGVCVWKNSTRYSCSDIVRVGECSCGGGIDSLFGKCLWVNDEGGSDGQCTSKVFFFFFNFV